MIQYFKSIMYSFISSIEKGTIPRPNQEKFTPRLDTVDYYSVGGGEVGKSVGNNMAGGEV